MDNDSSSRREEILKKIISDYSRKEESDITKIEKVLHKEEKTRKFRKIYNVTGVTVILILVIRLILIVVDQNNVLDPTQFRAMGKRVILDTETDECIGNLWQIRKAIDAYYADYREFPKNMEDLYSGNYLKETLVCPATGKGYVFSKDEDESVFACPNPEKHGASSVECDVESAVPIIKR